jgi:predicted DNA-binding transcriptional regulator AlpA
MDNHDQLIRVRQAAVMLGVCPRLVWKMLSKQELKRIKLPGCRVTCILLSQVQAMIEKLKGGR